MTELIHDLIRDSAGRHGDSLALSDRKRELSYAELDALVDSVSSGFAALGLKRLDRVAMFAPKGIEAVAGLFGASRAGGVFVPVNPSLKPRQVAYILADCNVRFLLVSADRLRQLSDVIADCPDLETIIVLNGEGEAHDGKTVIGWDDFIAGGAGQTAGVQGIDADMAAILYTSGSTGNPKGVVLSHRNMVAGARSVATYLKNTPEDRILSVLPLSFDYGLSQLTTAFSVGASVILLNYLLPRDVIKAVVAEKITGLACVPPLWLQLADLDWPEEIGQSLRYVTNSGGKMPNHVTRMLQERVPATEIYLMYGLTEAFRSTYLPPSEVSERPDSIGKAIPFAEIMVVDKEGRPCPPDTPGELVHRGALVAMGYWNDPDRTAQRFKPAPGQPAGIPVPELAVWSGDTVTMDAQGYLYFVGRDDEMIKSSGYRISPTEIEDVLYASKLVSEAIVTGVPHPRLGQGIIVIAVAASGQAVEGQDIVRHCQQELPSFMVPGAVILKDSLPRNPNGKIDRKALGLEVIDYFKDEGT